MIMLYPQALRLPQQNDLEVYKYCYYDNVCKNEDISITINNIFLIKVKNSLLNLYRLHMFIIKITIGKPIVNDSSMNYKYCYY